MLDADHLKAGDTLRITASIGNLSPRAVTIRMADPYVFIPEIRKQDTGQRVRITGPKDTSANQAEKTVVLGGNTSQQVATYTLRIVGGHHPGKMSGLAGSLNAGMMKAIPGRYSISLRLTVRNTNGPEGAHDQVTIATATKAFAIDAAVPLSVTVPEKRYIESTMYDDWNPAPTPSPQCAVLRSSGEPPIRVGDFMDAGQAKALRIRVLRYRGAPGHSWPATQEVRAVVLRVWQARFTSADCNIGWAEASLWSVDAAIDYDDGRVGALLTDGSHVRLQDSAGHVWFLRLLPAAQ